MSPLTDSLDLALLYNQALLPTPQKLTNHLSAINALDLAIPPPPPPPPPTRPPPPPPGPPPSSQKGPSPLPEDLPTLPPLDGEEFQYVPQPPNLQSPNPLNAILNMEVDNDTDEDGDVVLNVEEVAAYDAKLTNVSFEGFGQHIVLRAGRRKVATYLKGDIHKRAFSSGWSGRKSVPLYNTVDRQGVPRTQAFLWDAEDGEIDIYVGREMPCTNTNDGYNNLRDGDNKQIRIIYVLIGGEWVMACVLYWQGPLKYMFKTDLANLVMKNSRWKSIGMYTGVDGVMRKFKLENPSKRPQSDTSPIPGEGVTYLMSFLGQRHGFPKQMPCLGPKVQPLQK